MDYIINNNRYKKTYNKSELPKYVDNKKRLSRFPQYYKNYYNFFTYYARKNYILIDNDCLCKAKNDILLSETDRHCVKFLTCVCKNCGLVRAKKYYRNQDVINFYQKFYRTDKYYEHQKKINPIKKFEAQKLNFKSRIELLNKYKINELKNKKIVDVGGGAGGSLEAFDENNELFLFDYYDPFLKYAKSRGINTFKGGLEKLNFKPDVIILSHVMEHWNNFEAEIEKLIKVQKIGQTLNYIEFPGIDSLKNGRNQYDILRDIHVPHVYYFASYVFENLMNRYGFEKLYIDSSIKSIFLYTGVKKKLINYYHRCKKDIELAEKKRKITVIRNFIKLLVPDLFLKLKGK